MREVIKTLESHARCVRVFWKRAEHVTNNHYIYSLKFQMIFYFAPGDHLPFSTFNIVNRAAMKLSGIARRIAHLDSIVTWCKVVAGFILIILFNQEADENRSLNQAITVMCILVIGMYVFFCYNCLVDEITIIAQNG